MPYTRSANPRPPAPAPQEHCKGIPTVVVANKIDIDYKVRGGTRSTYRCRLLSGCWETQHAAAQHGNGNQGATLQEHCTTSSGNPGASSPHAAFAHLTIPDPS